jgi:hypothetical protein
VVRSAARLSPHGGKKVVFMITFEDAENIVRASVAKSRGPGFYRTDEALIHPEPESGTHLLGLIETMVSDPHLSASAFRVDPGRLAALAGHVTIDSLVNELRLSTRKLCSNPTVGHPQPCCPYPKVCSTCGFAVS